ncbi:MAG: CD225/dispanin family protein [bacterium]
MWSILSTLFCCFPFGLVSIVYSSQVNSKLNVGDIPGATEASGKARTWIIVGIVAGVIANVIGLILLLSFGVFAASTSVFR